MIVPEVEKYWEWLAGLAAVPVLRTFRTEMDRLREAELAEAMRKLEHLSSRDREAIEHFSRALMNKFLHEPSVRLRAAAANGRGLGVVDALRYLFDLRAADAASADERRRRPRQARSAEMPRRALVTGGAGFIGSHVADLLIANGYAVTVVDNLSSGKRSQVPAGARRSRSSISAPPRRPPSCAAESSM